MRIFLAVWIGFLMMAAIATAAGCRSEAFGRERRERLTAPDSGMTSPQEIVVSAPFPDGVAAKCLSREEEDGLTWVTFLMNDEVAIPVVSPDDGVLSVGNDHPRTLAIATVDATLIRLRRVRDLTIHDNEEVFAGEPLGFAASSEVFGVAVEIAVQPLREDAIVLFRMWDLSEYSARVLGPDELVCGLTEGHLYASGNAPSLNHPVGTLIARRAEHQVFQVQRDGTRREVQGDLSACANLETLPLVSVGPGEMHCLREFGEPIEARELCLRLPTPPTGALYNLPGQDQTLVVLGGAFVPIADRATFLSLGYDRAMVREMPESALDVISLDARHPFTLRDARNCIAGEPFPEAPL